MSIDPTEGPPGTEITASATGCDEDVVTITLTRDDGTVLDETETPVEDPADDPDDEHGGGHGYDDVESLGFASDSDTGGTGDWSGVVRVPDDEELVGETLTVEAVCNPVYEPASFIVVEPPTEPTTPEPTLPPTAPAGPGGPAGPSGPTGASAAGTSGGQGTGVSPATPATPVNGMPSVAG
jgi:hypothetical protein